MDPDRAFHFAEGALQSCRSRLQRGGDSHFYADLEAALHWAMDGWLTTHSLSVKAPMYSSTNQANHLAFREHAAPELANEVGYLLSRSVLLEFDGPPSSASILEELTGRAEKLVAGIIRDCLGKVRS